MQQHPVMSHGAAMGLLLSALVGLLTGCDRAETASTGTSSGTQGNKSGVTNAQPATRLPANSAGIAAVPPPIVDQIAEAWCNQQRACDRVGTGRRYSAFFECMTQMREAVRDDLTGFNCPRGIDATRTQPCMAEIEREDCTHDLVTLMSLADCRGEVLCAK
jgi:hypothetical protein